MFEQIQFSDAGGVETSSYANMSQDKARSELVGYVLAPELKAHINARIDDLQTYLTTRPDHSDGSETTPNVVRIFAANIAGYEVNYWKCHLYGL